MHICWAGESSSGRSQVVERIVEEQLWGALALRGDATPHERVTGEDAAAGVAARLAELSGVQRVFVAGHPGWWPRLSPFGERHGVADEASWVAQKVAAAAAYGHRVGIITQVCLDAPRFVDFVVALRAAGCSTPVHAGIMVAKSAAALRRVATMAGIEVPPDVEDLFTRVPGPQQAGALAAELWRLADASAVPIEGVHFFGMNDTKLMCETVRVMNMNTK